MKKLIACGLAAFGAGVALATTATIPLDSVTVTQNLSHRLFVNYMLENGPAIVTFEVLTNGVSIGDAPISNAEGDVFKKVDSGARSFMWNTVKGWPGHNFPKGGDVTVSVRVIAWDVHCAPNVMVIDLLNENDVRYYASLEGLPSGGVEKDVYKTDKLVLRKIPAEYVTWKMGSPSTEPGYNAYNDKQHPVKLTKDFYLGVYEVTQQQWFNVMGTKPAYFNNAACWATRPVEKVGYSISDGNHAADVRGNNSWPTGSDPHAVHADSFFGKLRIRSGLTALDLPTEAQWEYAARAGSGGPYYGGLAYGDANLATIARYRGNGYVEGAELPAQDCLADVGTAKVGSYLPNVWGLYDMLGNVDELCLDRFTQYGEDEQTDPVGSSTANADFHIFRGGSWREVTAATRCGSGATYSDTNRYQVDASARIWELRNHIGFRVCLHQD